MIFYNWKWTNYFCYQTWKYLRICLILKLNSFCCLWLSFYLTILVNTLFKSCCFIFIFTFSHFNIFLYQSLLLIISIHLHILLFLKNNKDWIYLTTFFLSGCCDVISTLRPIEFYPLISLSITLIILVIVSGKAVT